MAFCAIIINGCSSVSDNARTGQTYSADNLKGLVVGDESNSVLIGREVLNNNGTAVDAAIAMSFALNVTLPSHASIGGGGACMIYREERLDEATKKSAFMEVIDFQNLADGTPMMLKGLNLMFATYGTKPWGSLVGPAEKLARFGFTPSRAFQNDIKTMPIEIQSYFNQTNDKGAFINKNLADSLSEIRLKPEIFISGEGAKFFQNELLKYQGNYPNYLVAKPNLTNAYKAKFGDNIAGQFKTQELPQQTADYYNKIIQRDKNIIGTPQGDFSINKEKLGDILALGQKNGTGFAIIDSFGYAVACNLSQGNKFGSKQIVVPYGFTLADKSFVKDPALTIIQNPSANSFRAVYVASASNSHVIRCTLGLRNKLLTQSCSVAQGTGLPGLSAEAF